MTVLVPHAVDRARLLALPALRAAVDRLDPPTARVVSYHLGWTEADGQPTAASGGKALRPTLALLSAQAAGAPPEIGVPGAVAVELVHNFSLLHDDLMDGDVQRRHRPTAWTVFGAAHTILAGDALLALAQEVLLEAPAHGREASQRLAVATRELVRGQVADVAFERRPAVSLAECLAMAAGKTAALLACSASIGAILAGARSEVVAALSSYGDHLGLAFQLVDDLLGIWGDTAATGKPVLSDLRTRKKTAPVAAVLDRGGQRAQELRAWLATDGDGESESALFGVAALIERAGGRAWTEQEAHRQLGLAEDVLRGVDIPPPVRAELVDVSRFVVVRDS
jgi:geranylgeranyl diphosphate synthase type I